MCNGDSRVAKVINSDGEFIASECPDISLVEGETEFSEGEVSWNKV